jgi:hypothetical protein
MELSGIYTLILLVIWTPRPWQGALWVIAAGIVIYIAYLSFEGLRPMGLCTANLVRSLWASAGTSSRRAREWSQASSVWRARGGGASRA